MSQLLLRLFQSQFFSTWLAVSYLYKHIDNIGVQFYLCHRLKEFPVQEIEFLLPQLLHLVLFYPQKSIALQDFLIECCHRSTHFVLLMYWYLDAYIPELKNLEAVQICQELHSQCLSILSPHNDDDGDEHDAGNQLNFNINAGDNSNNQQSQVHVPQSESYQSLSVLKNGNIQGAGKQSRKVNGNIASMIIGMSMVAASAADSAKVHGALAMAIRQGQMQIDVMKSLQHLNLSDHSNNQDDGKNVGSKNGSKKILSSSYTKLDQSPSDDLQSQFRRNSIQSGKKALLLLDRVKKAILQPQKVVKSSPSLEELHQGDAFSFKQFVHRTKSSLQSSSSPEIALKRPRHAVKQVDLNNFDDLEVLNVNDVVELTAESAVITSSQSVAQQSQHSQSQSQSQMAVTRDQQSNHQPKVQQRRQSLATVHMWQRNKLAQSKHYYHSELQFIYALNSIADRLLLLPKPIRQSSLKAELALLNHNLPAKVCLPLWCCHVEGQCSYHHSIVRIVVDEGVVLNSADRVPYLILVEVIEADLDIEELQELSIVSSKQSKSNSRRTSNLIHSTLSSSSTQNQSNGDLMQDQQEEELIPLSPVQMLSKNMFKFDETEQQLHFGNEVLQERLQNGFDNSVSPMVERRISIAAEASSRSAAHITPESDHYPKLRTAAIMLAQLSMPNSPIKPADQKIIQEKILQEMQHLEQIRQQALQQYQTEISPDGGNVLDHRGSIQAVMSDTESILTTDEQIIQSLANLKDDPSAVSFKESWESKMNRVRSQSQYGQHPNWRLLSCIVKVGADLRQEQLALQLIKEVKNIWIEEAVDAHILFYGILITSNSTGLIETIPNSISVHSMKRNAYAGGLYQKGKPYTIFDHYINTYGAITSQTFKDAQRKFMQSLVGYSLVTYILNIKDRHNGNILLLNDGHIVHIDFGFMFGNSPGNVQFESAPFKLLSEYVDLLGGFNSRLYQEFRQLMNQAFNALRKHSDKIILLVELMMKDSNFPCFQGNPVVILQQLKDRFQLSLTEKQVEDYVDRMILASYNNMFTKLYDNFQYYSNGIL
ncbi:hypothetical protein MP228_011444 [Amoeboaphelidium protococcarum]|nr:hypothetical protein MP228_011444 [Amoeboaphelidium protococcarum]